MTPLTASPPVTDARRGLENVLVQYVPAASVLELFDQATRLLRMGGPVFVTTASITSVPLAVGALWLVRGDDADGLPHRRLLVAGALASLVWLRHIGHAAAVSCLAEAMRGRAATVLRSFGAVAGEIPSILFIGSVRWLLVATFALFALVPGAWLSGRWLPALAVLIEERLRYVAVLRRAAALTANDAGRYWAAMLLLAGVVAASAVGVGIALNVAFWLSSTFLGFDAGYSQAILLPTRLATVLAFVLIAWVLLEPLRLSLGYVVYLDSLARFEGADLAAKLTVIVRD